MAQIQVSNAETNSPIDYYPRKGFMKVDGEEYFIEQGNSGTKVSLVKDGELEFMHELNYRPSKSNFFSFLNHDNKSSNSGLTYERSTLYEFYPDHICLVDIKTGELVESIDLDLLGFKLTGNFDFKIGQNYYLISFPDAPFVMPFRIDRHTKTVDYLEGDGIITDDHIFWISELKSNILYHDLETNLAGQTSAEYSNISQIQSQHTDLETTLFIRDDNGIHLQKGIDVYKSLDCHCLLYTSPSPRDS